MRTIVFGVDGLTFRILHPMMEQGLLPNFQKLRDEGCEAVLESKYPPLTPPAWTSLSTGLKPSHHGVYDFWTYDETQVPGESRKVHVLTRRKSGKAIWNILSEYGKKVLVINSPMTYPPEAVNGIMISGYNTPGTGVDFTYPSTFKTELFRVAPNYQIDLDVNFRERLNAGANVGPLTDAVLRMTEQRIKLVMHMLREKPWDFSYLVFIGADRLQHPFWEEVSALHSRTNEYFCMLDAALGEILALLEPEDSLFVVSDHGFCGYDTYFDINEYLYSRGLLTINDVSFERNRRRAKRASQARHLASRLGLRSVGRTVKRALKSSGMWATPNFDGLNRPTLENIDWEKTVAYVPSLSGLPGGFADIFLHPDVTQEQITELCDDLKRQKNPRGGKPLIDAIYTNEVYGTGPHALREPHLLLLPNEGVTFRLELGNEYLWENLGKSFGAHHKEGVFYAFGAPFKHGFRAPLAEIYDLVPTLLRTMQLPSPNTFDGRVLDELFVENQQADGSSKEGGLTRKKLHKLQEV